MNTPDDTLASRDDASDKLSPDPHSKSNVEETAHDAASSELSGHSEPTAKPKTTESAAQPMAAPNMSREEILKAVLKFLATADANSMGAVAAGLAAVTYFILGRVGLVLIGAVGGVVLFITLERKSPEFARVFKNERGTDIMERLLDVRRDASQSTEGLKLSEHADEQQITSFDDFRPETADALNELVDAIIRDYVRWWYNPIVPADKAFPITCRKTLTNYIVSISQHMSRKRPADAFLDLLTNSSSMVVVFFNELANAFADVPSDSDLTAVDAVYNYLASNPDCRLANLLSQKEQASKFRMISEDLLAFLDRPTYDCDAARVFLREILAGVILEMTLQTCSKPEWINGWIVYLLEAGEPDFNQAIDVGMQNATDFGDMDGNVGNVSVAKAGRKGGEPEKIRHSGHSKQLSKSVEETEEAMADEARKLNQMMAEAGAQEQKVEGKIEPNNAGQAPAERKPSELGDVKREEGKRSQTIAPEWHLPEHQSQLSPTDITSSGARNLSVPASPVSPHTSTPAPQPAPARQAPSGGFTSFDQFVPPNRLSIPDDDDDDRPQKQPPPLTLHNAKITIYDDAANDKGRIRSKPAWDYLVQVEPSSSQHPGWMIVRRYADFETLHEVLRRIAAVSGARQFLEHQGTLPPWKEHTRESLRQALERYVREACQHSPLAESEGMKRFFEKMNEQGHARSDSNAKAGFGGGFEAFGKNMFGALTNAPKGAFEGGKAVVGGVTGVFGNIGLGGQKKPSTPVQNAAATHGSPVPTPAQGTGSSTSLSNSVSASHAPSGLAGGPNRNSMPTLPRMDSLGLHGASSPRPRDSMDSQRSSIISVQPGPMPPMERMPSHDSRMDGSEQHEPRKPGHWDARGGYRSPTTKSSRDHSRASSLGPLRSPSTTSLEGIRLPPPPDMVADDYSPVTSEAPSRMGSSSIISKHESLNSNTTAQSSPPRPLSLSSPPKAPNPGSASAASSSNKNPDTTTPAPQAPISTTTSPGKPQPHPKKRPDFPPLSEPETRIAVELVFTMINELYTLTTSTWNVRLAILNTGKSFLLRPGPSNPSILSIQSIIQSALSSLLEDGAIATHLRTLRANCVPTEEERAAWPATGPSLEEKEQLRVKARRLLIEAGLPSALTGVMGQGATAEAVGRVFDALQIEEVARGLVFGVMLQGVRILTH